MRGNFDKSIGQGVQRYIYNLWFYLDKLMNKDEKKIEKIELGMMGSLEFRRVSFTILAALHNFKKYDIVHIPAPIMKNPKLKKDGKIVTTVHEFLVVKEDNGLYPEIKAATNHGNFVSDYVGSSIINQITTSDFLLPNSKQTMEEAISLGHPKEKLILVHHGFDNEFLSQESVTKKDKSIFTVGYIGAFNTRKNAKFAINAFKRIEDKDIAFTIWGKPALQYDSLLKFAGDDPRIHFMGFAPEEKLIDIYDSFNAFVFPSWYEGFGLEILEAQARGIPVIINKKGQISEEIRKYCFEAEDEAHMAQILKDLKDNGVNESRTKKAMEYASQFTAENTAKNTFEAYKKILGE